VLMHVIFGSVARLALRFIQRRIQSIIGINRLDDGNDRTYSSRDFKACDSSCSEAEEISRF
jgi:hypothetical protein